MVFDTLSKFANLKCSEISCDFVLGSQVKRRLDNYFKVKISLQINTINYSRNILMN